MFLVSPDPKHPWEGQTNLNYTVFEGYIGNVVADPNIRVLIDYGSIGGEVVHFPDGSASLARLMVRTLIPAVAAGQGMDDVVTAAFDYSKLDQPDSPVRLRLNWSRLLKPMPCSADTEPSYFSTVLYNNSWIPS